eukprot:816162_1
MAEEKSEGVQVYMAKDDPHGLRVLCALNIHKVKYSIKEVEIQNKSDEFKAAYKKCIGRDPTSDGTSPILVNGDVYIAESLAIIRYIDAIYSKQSGINLLPTDPLELAAVDSMIIFASQELFNNSKYFNLWMNNDKDKIKADIKKYEKSFSALNERLNNFNKDNGPFYLPNGKVSMVEVYIWTMLSRSIISMEKMKEIPITTEWFNKYTRVAEWYNAVKECEWVKQVPFDETKYLETMTKYLEYAKKQQA